MNYTIVELNEKLVVGIQKNTTNQNMQAVTDIAETWQKFITAQNSVSISNAVNNQSIGLYTDYEGDYMKPYNFVACCEVQSVNDLAPCFVVKKIPAGKYAKFSIRGHMQTAVGKAWQKIWSLDLARNYIADFEVYHNNSSDMNDQSIDIFIGIS